MTDDVEMSERHETNDKKDNNERCEDGNSSITSEKNETSNGILNDTDLLSNYENMKVKPDELEEPMNSHTSANEINPVSQDQPEVGIDDAKKYDVDNPDQHEAMNEK